MDRTTIMLPPELKTRAANHAKKKGISLGQYIRLALQRSLEVKHGHGDDNDSLFLDTAIFEATTPHDLASDHDAYLYSDER